MHQREKLFKKMARGGDMLLFVLLNTILCNIQIYLGNVQISIMNITKTKSEER